MEDSIERRVYLYDGFKIEALSYFLYEVCIYKKFENVVCLLGSRFFKSDRLLKTKVLSKRYPDGCVIEKELNLLGAPLEFIESKGLKVYNKRTKRNRKNSTEVCKN